VTLKESGRKALRGLRTWIAESIEPLNWMLVARRMKHPGSLPLVGRLLVIPSDPWTLTGARGDEAMVESAIAIVRKHHPDLSVAVLTATEHASLAAAEKGYVAIECMGNTFSYTNARDQIAKFGPDRCITLGADILDGYYGALPALRLLFVSDVVARLGATVSVLGFSFNDKPTRSVCKWFSRLSSEVHFHVRDEISLDRFTKYTNGDARLVADSAFHLPAQVETDRVRAVGEWCRDRHMAGRQVIVFNAHPMLVRGASSKIVQNLVKACAAAIAENSNGGASWILLPHDDRGDSGDNSCLAPISAEIREHLGSDLLIIKEVYTASEIKGLVGYVDGAIVGRMHLAIACLGQGTPTVALTYQDKFQGLFRHFDLPGYLLVSPDEILEGKLSAVMERFLAEAPELKAIVNERLPNVLRLSSMNFDRVTF
jgi:polysaccharide pyruvyl transferase WcaK-like protein